MSDIALPGGYAHPTLPQNRTAAGSSPLGAADVGDVGAEFEAAFLAEMLKCSGLTRAFGGLAGGAGESGFSDLLVREVAHEIARSRPLGIGAALAARLEAGE